MRAAFAERRKLKDEKSSDGHDKKFGPGKNPLEKELSLKIIEPSSSDELDESLKVIQHMIDTSDNRDQQVALHHWKAQLKTQQVKGIVHKQFLSDFQAWLIGRGQDRDHQKTPWGRQSLAQDPQISSYLDSFVVKRQDFLLDIEKLKLRVPVGINDAYKYFKFIVRGEPINFLEDFKYFEDEFWDARKAGQYYRDPDEFPYPHETAPYGGQRWKQAKIKKDAKKAKHVISGDSSSDDEQPGPGHQKPPAPTDDPALHGGGEGTFPVDMEESSTTDDDDDDIDNGPDQQTAMIVDALAQIRDLLQGQSVSMPPVVDLPPSTKPPSLAEQDSQPGKPPSPPSPPKEPVSIQVPAAAREPFLTPNVSIQIDRANQRVAELEAEIKRRAAEIDKIRRRYEDENAKQDQQHKSDLKELQQHKSALQAQVNAANEFRAAAARLSQQQQRQMEEMQRVFDRSLAGHQAAQASFIVNADRQMRELAERMQRGHVQDVAKFQQEIQQWQERTRTMMQQQANINQQQAREIYVAQQKASFAENIAKAAQQNQGNYEASFRQARQDAEQQIQQMQSELRQAAQSADSDVSVLKQNLKHLKPAAVEQVVSSVSRGHEVQEVVVDSTLIVDAAVEQVEKLPVRIEFPKIAKRAKTRLEKVAELAAQKRKAIRESSLEAEAAARASDEQQIEAEFSRFLPDSEQIEEQAFDSRRAADTVLETVMRDKRELDDASQKVFAEQEAFERTIKSAKKDSIADLETQKQEIEIEKHDIDLEQQQRRDLEAQLAAQREAARIAAQEASQRLAETVARIREESNELARQAFQAEAAAKVEAEYNARVEANNRAAQEAVQEQEEQERRLIEEAQAIEAIRQAQIRAEDERAEAERIAAEIEQLEQQQQESVTVRKKRLNAEQRALLEAQRVLSGGTASRPRPNYEGQAGQEGDKRKQTKAKHMRALHSARTGGVGGSRGAPAKLPSAFQRQSDKGKEEADSGTDDEVQEETRKRTERTEETAAPVVEAPAQTEPVQMDEEDDGTEEVGEEQAQQAREKFMRQFDELVAGIQDGKIKADDANQAYFALRQNAVHEFPEADDALPEAINSEADLAALKAFMKREDGSKKQKH